MRTTSQLDAGGSDGQTVENVLLVVVDALRYDRVSPSLTPNIAEVAETGERFDRCYACINATDSSMTTIMTGLYPTHHGLLNHGKNITQQEFRYVSGTKPLTQYLGSDFNRMGIDMLGRHHKRGFDEYLMERSSNEKWEGGWSISGRVREGLYRVGKRALLELPPSVRSLVRRYYYRVGSKPSEFGYPNGEWITDEFLDRIDAEEPWFGLIHYWDTHMPYPISAEFPDAVADREYEDGDVPLRELVEPISGSKWGKFLVDDAMRDEAATVGQLKRRYDAAVHYVDEQLGRIIDELRAEGRYEDTCIIITSDHGESLTENGIYFDHHGLYEPTVHVPLIIDAPGFDGRERDFVQHYDLAPTVLDLLDIDHASDAFDGRSLVPAAEGRDLDRDAVYFEEAHTDRNRAIRTDTHKYVEHTGEEFGCRYCDTTHGDALQLFDFTAAGEARNVMGRQPETTWKLRQELREWHESIGRPTATARDPTTEDYDESVLQRLEAMGYR